MSIRNAFFKLNQTSGVFGRWLSLSYILGIIIGPVGFLIISITEDHRIPWYFVLLAFLLLLSSIGFGISRFKQRDNQADDISISPDRQ
jgi:O-antigen/teichoic acid export membrane protein